MSLFFIHLPSFFATSYDSFLYPLFFSSFLSFFVIDSSDSLSSTISFFTLFFLCLSQIVFLLVFIFTPFFPWLLSFSDFLFARFLHLILYSKFSFLDPFLILFIFSIFSSSTISLLCPFLRLSTPESISIHFDNFVITFNRLF